MPDFSLYLVTDRELSRGRSIVEIVRAALAGGVTCVQLREKRASTRDFLTEAMAVGPARIGTVLCDQYAFRQEGVDWQVWIEQGDKPLPRKLVITTISEEAHPQFSALYTWNLQPTFKASTFTFTPPQDAHAIPLVEIEPPISPAQ